MTYLKNYLLFIVLFGSLYYSTNAQPFNDGHLSLDGINDNAYIASPVFTDQSDFTFELLFYDCGSIADYKILDALGSTAGSGIEIKYLIATKKVQIKMSNGTTTITQSPSFTVSSGSWYHLAVTHDESDSLNVLYMNGDSVFSFKSDFAITGDMGIGSSDDGPGKNSFFRGRMDEIRISNSVRYTGSSFTGSTSAFSDDANTLALWHFNDGQNMTQFADASGNGNTLAGYGGGHSNKALFVSPDTTIMFGTSITLTATGGNIFYWSPPTGLSDTLSSSPIATPDSTTTYTVAIYDSNYCQTSLDVIVSVTPYIAPDQLPFNGCLSLDGVNDYALINSAIFPNSSDFTVETYFKICNSGYNTLFDALNSTAGDGMQVQIYGGGNSLDIGIIGASGYNSNSYQTFSGLNLDLTNWHHIAITHNNTDSITIIYIDGDSIGSLKSDFASGGSTNIGSGYSVNGFVDEFRISNTLRYTDNFSVPVNEFTADANTKVLWHFNDGDNATSFADASSNAYTLTGYAGAHIFDQAITYPSDTTIKLGESVNLICTGGNVYNWSPSTGLSDSTLSNVTATPLESTTYNLIISDSNACELANVDISINVYSASPIDNFLSFDGVDDYGYTPNQIFPSASDFTVEFLFKLCDTINYSVLIDALGSTSGYGIEISHSYNSIKAHMIGPTGYLSYSYLSAPISVDYSKWHHLAFTHSYTDSLNIIYMDGDSIGSFTGAFQSGYTATFGRTDYTASNFLNGYMDEIRVSNNIRYTADFMPSTTAFTTDSKTLELWHFDNELNSQEFDDEASNNYTIVGYNQTHLYTGFSEVSSDTIIKLGGSATLVADGGDAYSWTSGNDDTLIVSPSITTTYYVYTTNYNSCDSVTIKDSVTVTVDTTIVTGVQQNTIAADFMYNLYSSSNGDVIVKYNLNQVANVHIELYNVLGERIAILLNEYQAQGLYSLKYKVQNAGIYLMHLTVNGKDYVKKISLN